MTGYPVAYRNNTARSKSGGGFQKSPAMLQQIMKQSANDNSVLRKLHLVGPWDKPRQRAINEFNARLKYAQGRPNFGTFRQEIGYAGIRSLPRIAARLAPWSRGAGIALDLAGLLFQRAFTAQQQLARGNTLVHQCGDGAILSNTRTAPNCGLSQPKVMPFPKPLGWPDPVQWGWWTQENQTIFMPPTFNCTNWSVWSKGTGLPLNPKQQQHAPSFRPKAIPRKHFALDGERQPHRAPVFYSPPWPEQEELPEAPPMIYPPGLPIGKGAPTPVPIPFWMIPYVGNNPWLPPTEQPQKGNDLDDDFPDWPKPKQKPRPQRGGKVRRRGGRSQQLAPISPKWTSTQHEPAGAPLTRNEPAHRDRPPQAKTKETKSKASPRTLKLIRFLNQVTEWQDWVEALYNTLPVWVRAFAEKDGKLLPHEKAMVLYRRFDQLDVETSVKALVRNEIQDFILGLMGQVSTRAAIARGGMRLDTHGRAMRKLQRGTGKAVNEVVDRIMKDVFNEKD